MKDRIYIRNAEAAQLARTLARQTGNTVTEIVLDALRHHRPSPGKISAREEAKLWRRLLQADRMGMRQKEMPVDALYDEATGLPT